MILRREKKTPVLLFLILAFIVLTLTACGGGGDGGGSGGDGSGGVTLDPISRVSVDSTGAEGDFGSFNPSASSDGRYVAFDSDATNLVAGDTNGRLDVFVHDRQTGATARVSVDSNGVRGDNDSFVPSISSDGRYVAFGSRATSLVSGDTNAMRDIFVHDRQAGSTTRVSVDSSGAQGDNGSFLASISSDGRYVAFQSDATNLVAGDTNTQTDIFVRDRQTGATTRVSVDSNGTQGNVSSIAPSISADGWYVAFESAANNLVTGDTNSLSDIFVHDRQTGSTTRVSVDSSGAQGITGSEAPSISADGRYVAFYSTATNLVSGDTNITWDVFVHDRQTGTTTRVSVDSTGAESDGWSGDPSISADGRYVAFGSEATNLVAGDTNALADIFIHDRQTGATTRVNVDSSGVQSAIDSSRFPSISADGSYVSFESDAANLVIGDMNFDADIFLAPNE